MKQFSFIVQGEGKGHFSQSLSLAKELRNNNSKINCFYISRSLFKDIPSYFKNNSEFKVIFFYSPAFLRTADKKGIHVFSSVLINLVLSPVYIFEIFRLAVMLRKDGAKYIFNHYDPVGALAARLLGRRIHHAMVSHHFYLSHPDYIHPHGYERSFFLLQWMNAIMMKQAHRVFALSFREGKKFKKIEVIPPIIDQKILNGIYVPGERDLCYFLNEGNLPEIIEYYNRNPEKYADIFVKDKVPGIVPQNIVLHAFSREKFIECMLRCKLIITSGGFDTAAEAFYLGIPVYMMPAKNHYEQYCNAIDAARTGMAYHLDNPGEYNDAEFQSISNKKYKKWVRSFNTEIFLDFQKDK